GVRLAREDDGRVLEEPLGEEVGVRDDRGRAVERRAPQRAVREVGQRGGVREVQRGELARRGAAGDLGGAAALDRGLGEAGGGGRKRADLGEAAAVRAG